jgi:hypothetical protein
MHGRKANVDVGIVDAGNKRVIDSNTSAKIAVQIPSVCLAQHVLRRAWIAVLKIKSWPARPKLLIW